MPSETPSEPLFSQEKVHNLARRISRILVGDDPVSSTQALILATVTFVSVYGRDPYDADDCIADGVRLMLEKLEAEGAIPVHDGCVEGHEDGVN